MTNTPALAPFVLMGLAACGGGRLHGEPNDGGGGEASSPTGADGGSGPRLDSGASCPGPSADAGLLPFESPASGTVSGPDVGCTVCNVAAHVFVQSYATYPTTAYLELSQGAFQFTEPKAALDASITGIVEIAAAAPGTYTSSDASNCGNLLFSYQLPVPPGVDCGDGTITGPNCPPGCSIGGCSGFGCGPCVPLQPEGLYVAQGGGTCLDMTEQASGSWMVTLTSVEPYTGDAGMSQGRMLYAAHGSLTAHLLGGEGDAGNEPAIMTLAF